MGANELSALLWRERELLELLVFKLEEEQLLLQGGKSRWLQHATREVEQVLTLVREAGLGRSVEVAALATEWGSSQDATLRELAASAPSGPWTEILGAHLKAMADLTTQIKQLKDVNEQFIRAASRSTQETLAGLNPDVKTYDAHGATDVAATAARLFDRNL
ncbi:flagellar biosynthesis protein FlgN [Cryobacterium roopkundense]|uniref:Flagellar biosynthesis protein FlgN n=1 Tax=Cryobacterium roopkundense TaxID=1001240 RepID=A0A099JPE4_9MICO|nr:flagellar protein FlgN [Cryobacterium roopkundense]KGJ79507.1 flagellar biosynthesis protein FlgN [Cryobacterium roopkundense]MBB5640805.1 flagellar biosynthesis/type III secretory pathway chaperone [Cryobacterium roopkundense]